MKRLNRWLHEEVDYFWCDMMINQGGWQRVPRWFKIIATVESWILPCCITFALIGSMAVFIFFVL